MRSICLVSFKNSNATANPPAKANISVKLIDEEKSGKMNMLTKTKDLQFSSIVRKQNMPGLRQRTLQSWRPTTRIGNEGRFVSRCSFVIEIQISTSKAINIGKVISYTCLLKSDVRSHYTGTLYNASLPTKFY